MGWGTYLIILNESKQHGYDDLTLGVEIFPCISLVCAPQYKKVINNWLQGWDGWKTKQELLGTFPSEGFHCNSQYVHIKFIRVANHFLT